MLNWSRDSSFGIAMRYGRDDTGSVLGMVNIFSFPQSPERFLGPLKPFMR